jgi:hypothetical protein
MDSIDMAHDRDKWQALENVVPSGSIKYGKSLD